MPHVLLIEDDLFLQRVYVAEFKKAGYQVSGASDGSRGVSLMKNSKPDVVVLDIIMPKMNGFEVLEARKKDPELMKIPVIVLSSLGQDSDISKAKSLGANEYFVKSTLDVEELKKAMTDVEGLKALIEKVSKPA